MFSEGKVIHIMLLVTRAHAKLHQAFQENDEPITTKKFAQAHALLDQAEKDARLIDVPFDGNEARVAREILERIERVKEDE